MSKKQEQTILGMPVSETNNSDFHHLWKIARSHCTSPPLASLTPHRRGRNRQLTSFADVVEILRSPAGRFGV
jgi:hypothetical protein